MKELTPTQKKEQLIKSIEVVKSLIEQHENNLIASLNQFGALTEQIDSIILNDQFGMLEGAENEMKVNQPNFNTKETAKVAAMAGYINAMFLDTLPVSSFSRYYSLVTLQSRLEHYIECIDNPTPKELLN